MTVAEAADLITSIAAVAAVVVSVFSLRRLIRLEHNTNGMKDELVAEVRKSAYRNGQADEGS